MRREEEEAMDALRPEGPQMWDPPPSRNQEEQGAPSKKSMVCGASPESKENANASEPATPAPKEPAPAYKMPNRVSRWKE